MKNINSMLETLTKETSCAKYVLKKNRYYRKYLDRTSYTPHKHGNSYQHDREWVDDNGVLKRWYYSPRSKYYKKYSNRKIRNYSKGISNGRSCYKIYDYWWEID